MPLAPLTENTLYYGNRLNVLRKAIVTESVDLIYLDHPSADRKHA